MKKIVPFRDEEGKVIDNLITLLTENGRLKEIVTVENNMVALKELARSISLYPSILKEQHLGSATRSVETLVDSMCRTDEFDFRLRMPTKALLGNGFLIAKINFFYMLIYLCDQAAGAGDLKESIRLFISNNIFTMMAEDVFLSIIEDCGIDQGVRMKAGYFIADIWERRLDHGVKEFVPILSEIWRAREKLVPAFGTMLGFSELFRISGQIEPAFLDFFQRDELTDEEISSIEEFIFGLTFEETASLRSEMEKRNKFVLCREEVEEIIGHNRIYVQDRIQDFRDIYHSFKHRKTNAKYRARAKLAGPHKTIEEYIMCYLLARSGDLAQ